MKSVMRCAKAWKCHILISRSLIMIHVLIWRCLFIWARNFICTGTDLSTASLHMSSSSAGLGACPCYQYDTVRLGMTHLAFKRGHTLPQGAFHVNLNHTPTHKYSQSLNSMHKCLSLFLGCWLRCVGAFAWRIILIVSGGLLILIINCLTLFLIADLMISTQLTANLNREESAL